MKNKKNIAGFLLAVGISCTSLTHGATIVYNGGSLYGGYADSPFAATFGSLSNLDGVGTPVEVTEPIYDFRGLGSSVAAGTTYFFLEDWQDGQTDAVGLVNAEVARTDNGRNGSDTSGFTDSVAEDNTAPFGSFGTGSLRSSGTSRFNLSFTAADLGGLLPTYVGFALTESARHIDVFEAYDSMDNLITGAEVPTNNVDLSQDEFFGFQTDVGISRVFIRLSAGGELDHFQYGHSVPEPSLSILFSISGLALIFRRRK